MRTCEHAGCDREHAGRGLCKNHWNALRKRQTAYGRWESRYTDAAPTRAHIAELHTVGVSYAVIADRAGINPMAVSNIANGTSSRVLSDTERSVLAVRVPALSDLAPDVLVANVGCARRLQALAAIGWQAGKLCAELGWRNPQLTRIRSGTQKQVTCRTALQVEDLYDRLWNVAGGHEKTLRWAGRMGFALPLEWDDIDDPIEVPSGRRPFNRGVKVRAVERIEAVEVWLNDPRPEFVTDGHNPRCTDTDITKGTAEMLAGRLGCTVRTVERDKARIRAQRAGEVAA